MLTSTLTKQSQSCNQQWILWLPFEKQGVGLKQLKHVKTVNMSCWCNATRHFGRLRRVQYSEISWDIWRHSQSKFSHVLAKYQENMCTWLVDETMLSYALGGTRWSLDPPILELHRLGTPLTLMEISCEYHWIWYSITLRQWLQTETPTMLS